VALAQQGWEPTVSVVTAPPNAPARPAVKVSARSANIAVAVSTAAKSREQTDETILAVDALPVPPADLETGSVKGPPAGGYCANIADTAADARFAWQKKALADMEQEILKRIALLEEKTEEYKKWLARRDEFSRKANETVLRIYERMRPDAAAAQLAALDGETAASVLTKLQPRIASLILNEMDRDHAVRLTATISGAGKIARADAPSAKPETKAK
jgi:flagellar motility protein MotE (MotC chaperone)